MANPKAFPYAALPPFSDFFDRADIEISYLTAREPKSTDRANASRVDSNVIFFEFALHQCIHVSYLLFYLVSTFYCGSLNVFDCLFSGKIYCERAC